MIVGERYDIGKRLGAGAVGTVHVARDLRIGRSVAIKLVRRPPRGDDDAEEAYERFRVEAHAAGRLAHPNIATVYDFGESDDVSWIVMELVEGASLKDLLSAGHRFSVLEISRLMGEMLAALACVHDQGIVHRDIKPANILLTPSQQVKIVDFGIARLGDSTRTLIGVLLGTPAYMSPEQLRGDSVDHRADIWSAGVVLYELLTGEKPFSGSPESIIQRALFTDPPTPSHTSKTAPHAFDAVVARALAKGVEARFQSATAFANAIRTAATVANDDVTAPAASPRKRWLANPSVAALVNAFRNGTDREATAPNEEATARFAGPELRRDTDHVPRGRRDRTIWHLPRLRRPAALGAAWLTVLVLGVVAGLAIRGSRVSTPPAAVLAASMEAPEASSLNPSSGTQPTAADPVAGGGGPLALAPQSGELPREPSDLPAPVPSAQLPSPTAGQPEPPPFAQPIAPSVPAPGLPPADLPGPPPSDRPAPHQGEAFVMPMHASVRAGPDGTATVVRSASRGTLVRVFARSGRWLQIGEEEPWGWVHDSRVPAANRQK